MNNHTNSPGAFTVVIATRNRADHLRRCLRGLIEQVHLDHSVPIIVVDNASKDETRQAVSEFDDHLDLQYAYEPQIGLSHGRNAALSLAATDYVIFLDDDGIPQPGWTAAIAAGIAKWNPDLFGGPYIPHYLTPKPDWFEDRFGSAHLEMTEGLASRPCCFSGGNMGWRTSLLRELGGFSPDLGMQGMTLRLGEETSLQMRLWSEAPQLNRVMLPEMLMTHYVSPEKMRLRYIWKRSFTYGRQLGEINPSDPLWQNASCMRAMWRCKCGIPLIARLLQDTLLGRERWKTYAADWMSRFAIHFGAAYERLAL